MSLSSDDNTLAVGVPGEDSSATGINGDESSNGASASSAVYLFSRTETSWNQQAYLKASNTGDFDSFGESLVLSGDGNTLAVGAYEENSSSTGINGDESDEAAVDSGAVYVFGRAGGAWNQKAYLKAPNTNSGDELGEHIALSSDGNTLVIGAGNENSSTTGINGDESGRSAVDAGAVYFY